MKNTWMFSFFGLAASEDAALRIGSGFEVVGQEQQLYDPDDSSDDCDPHAKDDSDIGLFTWFAKISFFTSIFEIVRQNVNSSKKLN